MVSINASSASLSAVRVLQSVNSQLDTTQNRISTGLKVASAKDGAAAWSAASTIRSEIKTNEALRSGIDTYVAAADVATAAAEQIVSALTSMKTAVNAYSNTTNSTDQAVYATQIAAAQKTIVSALAASKTGSLDWLNSTSAITVNVGVNSGGALVSQSFTPAANFTTTLTATAISASAPAIATFVTTFTTGDLSDADEVAAVLADIDANITSGTTLAANLGALSANLTSSKEFLAKIADIKSGALSNLVDADMEEESVRLSALQTQQALATQAISIANASSQNILRLFQ